MANVLITGGAGYIGSHAAWACVSAGHKVIILDDLSTGIAGNIPPEAAFILGDAGDKAALKGVFSSHHIDAIMHFAGSIVVPESVEDPGGYYQNNTVNSLTLAGAAIDAGVKAFVFSSTAAVYAPGQSEPLDETAPKGPLSPYGQSKLMTEIMLADLSRAHGLAIGVLRYFNVAGADPLGRTGQSSPKATHLIKVACQVATGQRDQMAVFGTDYDTPDGTCIRDYIHVSDLADAHVLVLQHLLSGGENITANCGYGTGASVREVLAALEAQIGRAIPVTFAERRAGDAPVLVADSALLKSKVAWTPRFDDLGKIIEAALAWEQRLSARAG